MTHLTDDQIQILVDQTGSLPERENFLRHTESCQRCARELAFQRSLATAIRKSPVGRTSRGFTARVMSRVAPELKQSFLFRLFGGAGRGIAMAAVLGIIAYALTLNVPGTADQNPWFVSDLFKEFSSYYGAVKEFVSERSASVNQTVDAKASAEGMQVAATTLVVLVILGLLDRFVLRHVVRMKPGR